MTPETVGQLFEKLKSVTPTPKTELEHHNAFELLLAVMLSAQATDVSVNKVTPELFKQFPNPQAMVEAGEARILEYIKTIGLAKTKAKNIIKTCQSLIDHHDSRVPHTREELEALAGVGRKTANVVLNTAFGEPTIAVDTHVLRVSNRTGLTSGKTPLEVENQLLQVVPSEWKQEAHHLLILHGRYVCKARKPDCLHCVIEAECEF
ncbi:endonuclease III [Deltaproteobacteria bacterium TL4]